uniref:Uncharacterized protein n=1 Tax=Oryza sativa subsp. japonica TaxID=39947 RepID=Q6YWM8_ORYSJ|nr:hypothetical protein [Oryza sativa Japonica Group]BAD20163.1 hypothetical protein [Oryza sativa Japonica Group]
MGEGGSGGCRHGRRRPEVGDGPDRCAPPIDDPEWGGARGSRWLRLGLGPAQLARARGRGHWAGGPKGKKEGKKKRKKKKDFPGI